MNRFIVAAACAASGGLCGAALAQTGAAAGASPAPAPSASALPGDSVTASFETQLHVPLGTPGGTHATSVPPADPTPSPPLALALEAARTAVDVCTADGYRVGVAVTDAAGHLKVGLAADGVAPSRVYIAIRKDITATAFKLPTLALRDKIAADPGLMAQLKPNMSVLPGGVPILVGDRLLGAIAASGAEAYEEEYCVKAGLRKIETRLRSAYK